MSELTLCPLNNERALIEHMLWLQLESSLVFFWMGCYIQSFNKVLIFYILKL